MPKVTKPSGEVAHFPYTDTGKAAAEKAKKAAKKGKVSKGGKKKRRS